MDTIVEGSQLSGISVVEDVLLHLSISSLVELVILSWSRYESGIGTIIHFMGGISEFGDVVKSLVGLTVVLECIVGKVVVPSNTIVKLTGGVVIVPFHGWVILKEVLKFG